MATAEVLLDSKLLLLWVVGVTDRALISEFKRTHMFSVPDNLLLQRIVLASGKLHTTPHVLSEVSNLANALPSHRKPAFARAFSTVLSSLTEQYAPAVTFADTPAFASFGLTNAAILALGSNVLILTQDGRFAAFARNLGLSAYDLQSAAILRSRL